jgi:protocatechuate 3,4-dioxygenase beta subunit
MSGLNLNVSAYESLSTPEQIFVITNLERVQRGLPPAVALTTQLNSVASTGIADSTDPILNGWTLTGGTQVYSWGSNWAEGTINPLGSDYYWVYDDGYPSDNGDCQTANAPGCWGHRDNILGTFISSSECSNNPSLYMGTANSNSQYDEIFAGGCGPAPSDEIFTWSQALAILGSSTTVPPPSIPTNVSATASNSTSVTVKWTASTDTGGPGLAGYYIYRNGTMIGNSTTTSYVDNTVAASTTYNYTVAAYDSDNPPNVSAQSPSASVTTPASSPVLTTVTGTVINASTNQPISGAYVTTGIHATANGAATTYTNSKGQYTLTNLIPNTSHSFYYTAGGYNEYTTSETYPAETAVLNVSMTPILNTTTVQGTVYNATTHAPIAGVYVTTGVYGTSNGAATATTNATGQYTLTNLVPNKTHDFYFTANGYDAYSTSETWPIGVYTLNANLTPL